jgi:hypothetical protein
MIGNVYADSMNAMKDTANRLFFPRPFIVQSVLQCVAKFGFSRAGLSDMCIRQQGVARRPGYSRRVYIASNKEVSGVARQCGRQQSEKCGVVRHDAYQTVYSRAGGNMSNDSPLSPDDYAYLLEDSSTSMTGIA